MYQKLLLEWGIIALKLNVVKLGLIDYKVALDLQMKLLKLNQQGKIEEVLLLLEHPPTITIGLNGKDSNVLLNEKTLKDEGLMVFNINRGGDVTYHGPGQVVGYPIMNLKNYGKDLKSYVRRLEDTTINLLKEEFGLEAERKLGFPGVWIGNNKITAIGCTVKRWSTMHGFALNVNTNLDHFKWINPCGFTDKGVTSLEKLMGTSQEIDTIIDYIIKHFSKAFKLEPEIIDTQIFLRKVEDLSNGE